VGQPSFPAQNDATVGSNAIVHPTLRGCKAFCRPDNDKRPVPAYHTVIIAAMKVKQNADSTYVASLKASIEALAPYYPEQK
jgi:hypothetical protein